MTRGAATSRTRQRRRHDEWILHQHPSPEDQRDLERRGHARDRQRRVQTAHSAAIAARPVTTWNATALLAHQHTAHARRHDVRDGESAERGDEHRCSGAERATAKVLAQRGVVRREREIDRGEEGEHRQRQRTHREREGGEPGRHVHRRERRVARRRKAVGGAARRARCDRADDDAERVPG